MADTQELSGPDTNEEVAERMPEVTDIEDEELREQVIDAVQELPAYFWTAPASSKYHPPEHRARHGLWLHTKRVCTAFERLAPSMVQQGFMSKQDVDHGRAACILHDMFKYGMPPTSVESTVDDHDIIAASWLRDNTDIPAAVCGAVEAHNGSWYQGRPPQSHLEQMVHVADMNASDANVRIAVKEPHEILREAFPRVSTRDDD